jgi:hypothetical protein
MRNLYFFEPAAGSPENPTGEIELEVQAFLAARGYNLAKLREDIYLTTTVGKAIRDKGPTYYLDIDPINESVLPDNTNRGVLSDTLRFLLTMMNPADELLIIDPYLFRPDPADADYIAFLREVFGSTIAKVNRVNVVAKSSNNPAVETDFRAMLQAVKPGVACSVKNSNVFHDRFWIGDGTKGIVVGTSLTGVGKRFALMDYIGDEDTAAIYHRYQAIP